MPVVNGDVLTLAATFSVGGNNTIAMNVYQFLAEDIQDGTESVVYFDLATRLDEMMTEIELAYADDYVLSGCRVTNRTQNTFVGDSPLIAWAGAEVAPENMPSQVAVEVLARSLSLGHVGRKYLGPIIEGVMNDGVVTAPNLALFEAYLGLYESAFVDPLSANAYKSGTMRMVGAAPLFTPFSGGRGRVVNVARTMRTRTPGRGLS
jgi:hypothetical protein